jgi:heat-inducible transcriptional repressor
MKDTSRVINLSEREQNILRLVVDSFIGTADPVGSRTLARRYGVGLSPASIRNTMSDLEDKGYLGHPHTSAGRVPTETGYRVYVDELMTPLALTPAQRRAMKRRLTKAGVETDEILYEGARLLGELSMLLGVVLSPRFSRGVLHRLDAIPMSSERLMFIISIRSGLVKTLLLEVESELRAEDVSAVLSLLNERLSGLTLEEIRNTYGERLRDLRDERSGIVNLVFKKASVIFSELPDHQRLRYAGAQNLVEQPEFHDQHELRQLVEFLESDDCIVQVVEDSCDTETGVSVRIGAEIEEEKAEGISLVTARYRIGNSTGTVGVVGPTRMDYARLVKLVRSMADTITRVAS